MRTAVDAHGLRVLVVTNMYPTTAEPHFGCFVRDQVDDMRRLGAEVTVLAFDGRGHRSRYAGAARRLHRALRRERFDVVHAHYGLSGAVAAMQLAVPVVTTFHGSDASVPWQRRVSWLVARRTQPIAVAPVIAANLGVRDAPVIPCAVDLELFAPVDLAEARRTLGWPQDGPCVLFPAARNDRAKVANKRVDVFDAMLERLRRSVPGAFAASLDGLSRGAGCPGDGRRRCRRADVALGRRARCREGGARVRDAGCLRRCGRRRRRGRGPTGMRHRASRPGRASPRPCRARIGAGRDARLREAMHAYGREPIAERVLGVYLGTLAGQAG